MARRGRCRCGAVITFARGPEGYKSRCPQCGAVVRLMGTSRPAIKLQNIFCSCGVWVAVPAGTKTTTCPHCAVELDVEECEKRSRLAPTQEHVPVAHKEAETGLTTLSLPARMVPCELCGTPVAADAERCSSCGAPQTRTPRSPFAGLGENSPEESALETELPVGELVPPEASRWGLILAVAGALVMLTTVVVVTVILLR